VAAEGRPEGVGEEGGEGGFAALGVGDVSGRFDGGMGERVLRGGQGRTLSRSM
jgi:hypothetical protein